MAERPPKLSTCLISGGLAGTAVDVILFPLDTIKTRIQSSGGLKGAGGFRSLYSGISSTLVGSAPSAALFFLTYESMKQALSFLAPNNRKDAPLIHVVSSSLAEVSACTVRVPIEVLKQRMQVFQYKSLSGAIQSVYKAEGVMGFYRGLQATLQREIPFACIQFPLYEKLKYTWRVKSQVDSLPPWKAALCGSVAGGITAALTTPFDVIKTRTMLSSKEKLKDYHGTIHSIKTLLSEGGFQRLFAGMGPRVVWISVGGFIFFGAYEKSKSLLL